MCLSLVNQYLSHNTAEFEINTLESVMKIFLQSEDILSIKREGSWSYGKKA